MSRILNNQDIENAFGKVRADFEKRKNTTGLEILDGYEAQWEETGSLSDKQLAWLSAQLDGSWNGKDKQSHLVPRMEPEIGEPARQQSVPQTKQANPDAHVDALIEQRLAEQGKVAIDAEHLDVLIDTIDELSHNAKLMRRG